MFPTYICSEQIYIRDFDLLASGDVLDQVARQLLDNLGENGYHSPRCLGVLFHSTVYYRTGNASKATLLYGKNDAADGRISGVHHALKRSVYGMLVGLTEIVIRRGQEPRRGAYICSEPLASHRPFV